MGRKVYDCTREGKVGGREQRFGNAVARMLAEQAGATKCGKKGE